MHDSTILTVYAVPLKHQLRATILTFIGVNPDISRGLRAPIMTNSEQSKDMSPEEATKALREFRTSLA